MGTGTRTARPRYIMAYDFDRIASTYDRFNHLLSLSIDRLWRRRAVRELVRCERLLDVAIGTADLAIEVCRQGKAHEVAGLDLSVEMMRIGAAKAAKAGYGDRISFTQGSALQMPYEEETFDAVTCAFGVRNFDDLDRGLKEMYRVLKSGSQVVVLEFSYPSKAFIRWWYDRYFSFLMPFIGRLIHSDKHSGVYLRESVKHFLWGEALAERLRQAGFKQVRWSEQTFGIATIYQGTK